MAGATRTLVEPIRDTKDVVFKLWPDPEKRVGPARPAAVGYIMGIRPAVDVAASCTPAVSTTSGHWRSQGISRTFTCVSPNRITTRHRFLIFPSRMSWRNRRAKRDREARRESNPKTTSV